MTAYIYENKIYRDLDLSTCHEEVIEVEYSKSEDTEVVECHGFHPISNIELDIKNVYVHYISPRGAVTSTTKMVDYNNLNEVEYFLRKNAGDL